MKSESEVKRGIVEDIRNIGGYARRIEDKFSVGFPDLIIRLSRSFPIVFAEVKIIRGRYFAPSPRQLIELKALDLAPVRALVVGYLELPHESRWSFSPPVDKIDTLSPECYHSTLPFANALARYLHNAQ